jgi:starch synthase
MPAYREVFSKGLPIEPAGIEFEVAIGTRRSTARILRCRRPGAQATVLLVANDDYYDRPTLYGGSEDYPDNAERFIFFARAAAELACRQEKPFDLVHCHDWQTGLVPAYLKLLHGQAPAVADARTVMTIHNMAYQGLFWHWDMLLTGLHWRYFNWQQMEFYNQLSLLKTGIVFADAVSTVSPTYAREIQQSPGGCGLEGLLASRSGAVTGIVNGIDTEARTFRGPTGSRTSSRASMPPASRWPPGSDTRRPTRGRWWRSWGGSWPRRAWNSWSKCSGGWPAAAGPIS